MNKLISYSLHVTKFYEDHNCYLSSFYFNYYYFILFYLFILFLFIFKGRQSFTPSVILDLELRFCTGWHLIREIVLIFLNMLLVLRTSSFIHLSSTTRPALQDALGAPRVPLALICFPCATFPSGCTTCSKGATRLFQFFLRGIPFRRNHMLQECHSPLDWLGTHKKPLESILCQVNLWETKGL